MTKKKWKQHICMALAMILLFSCACPVFATNAYQKKKSELSGAENKKDSLEDKISKLQDMKEELESSRRDLSSYVTELDSELNTMQVHISELQTLVEEKEEEIARTRQELIQAKKDSRKQYEQMKKRIRFMYERSASTYMELILHANSISDMLNKATYIEKLSSYDRDMLDKYEETKKTIVKLQNVLEEEKVGLEATVAETKANESTMQKIVTSKQEELEAYDADIANKEAAIKQYEEDLADQEALIRSLEAAVKAAEEAAAKAAAAAAAAAAGGVSGNAVVYNGGTFAWPAPSYTRISDDYGWRTHPILGVKQFHNGVDMAAPSGSPILAAADGEVIAASYSATMGNYIMINHGSGLITVYMHASSLLVSNGAKVSKGQTIALVGSTGRSTGSHLHFTVRLNGEYVSPWNYLK